MSDLRKPNGSELRDEELRRLIRELVPIDRDGTPLETPEADELKSRMLLVVEGDSESRRRTRLWEWEQLFATAPSAVRGLGAAIREHLASRQSDRIDEYDELGVTAGLDARDRQAAIDFRAAEAPPDQDATLYGLLTAPLRQRVDKLASQSRRVSDPLVAILRELYDLSIEDTEPTEIGLSQSTNPDAAELSRHLFACLYAPTLIEIATTSIDGPGHTFTVDAALLARGAVSRDNDDEDEDDHGWDPLDMALTVGARTVAEFRWDPRSTGLITLARLIQEAGGRNRLSQVESLEALDEKVANPGWTLPLTPIVALDDHIDSWLERRTTDFENWTSDGLDIDSLHEHVDEYEQLLAHAHNHYVPAGAPSPVLDQLLDLDAATTNVGSILLPTNPIRLRWFANHLQRLRQSITSALDGEVTLNRENPDLYFDWLSRVSPHQQPPVLVAGPDSLLISSRERGLVEAYAPITRHDGGDASLVDDKSVDEMAGVTRRYLEEYPHKLDGLSVLILDAAGSVNLARSFVNAIDSPELTLQVHVMAPTASLQTIGDELARFDRARDSTSGLMPAYQVVLHPWDDPSDLGAFDELDGRIDLVLAPDLFGSDVKVDANTREQREHAAGASDPWLTPPTHPQDFGSADTGPTAVEQLLPPLPDPLLEHWSTLAVRRYRTQVVQEGGIDNTDYFSLRILFAQHVPLFERLHHVAHWVVTLDRFVGRDQIDAVEQRPDVILVREGVGKSELYTLTVSSNSGREFITERLTRKLGRDLGLVEDPVVAGRVAERLYDVGRNVVPGVMLRALGLGRTAEEIIGLVTARRRIADQFPLTDHGTVEAWLSLDDFPHWFGGSQRRRADLLRGDLHDPRRHRLRATPGHRVKVQTDRRNRCRKRTSRDHRPPAARCVRHTGHGRTTRRPAVLATRSSLPPSTNSRSGNSTWPTSRRCRISATSRSRRRCGSSSRHCSLVATNLSPSTASSAQLTARIAVPTSTTSSITVRSSSAPAALGCYAFSKPSDHPNHSATNVKPRQVSRASLLPLPNPNRTIRRIWSRRPPRPRLANPSRHRSRVPHPSATCRPL